MNESRNITYGHDGLNRLTDETADASGSGYDIDYTYDIVGNRTQRVVDVNGQVLTTDYIYYPGTDRLQKETVTGPVYAVVVNNEKYYAYARPGGGKGVYYRSGGGGKVSAIWSFLLGLPSPLARPILVTAMIFLVVLLFCPAVIEVIRRLALCYGGPIKLRLCVPRKGICLLTAFVMLFEPAGFQQMAQASVRYVELNSASWGQGDRDIHYQYDNNGSLIEKIVAVKGEADPNSNFLEKTEYKYNLQNRLEEVAVTEDGINWDVTTYVYNDEGIRVEKNDNGTITSYLIDSFNHTGYAQVLEEWDTTGTPSLSRAYLIGDDVIAQTTAGTTQYLLYDGHGSTRQLAQYAGAVSVTDSYSYDGYGVLLQDGAAAQNNPGYTPSQATNLLYAGEYFDTAAQHYYNRARWYDPYNGRFNRTDPFFGNLYDPQSLHKYLYCHANPVNGIDPSGQFSLGEMLCVSALTAGIFGIIAGEIVRMKGGSEQQIFEAQWKWFWRGFAVGAIAYGIVWISHSILIAMYGSGAGLGGLQYADQYGIQQYGDLREIIRGAGLHAHHIIESRFADIIGIKTSNILSVALTPEEHQLFTNLWRSYIPYGVGTANATKELIWSTAQIVYADYPALLDASRTMLGM